MLEEISSLSRFCDSAFAPFAKRNDASLKATLKQVRHEHCKDCEIVKIDLSLCKSI
jgi:hypothetical protein